MVDELRSDISGFYKLSIEERQTVIAKLSNLAPEDMEILKNFGYFSPIQIDKLIENVIGSFQLPLGIACNFKVNEKDYLIPMVIEEPSVVAAASNAAKIARKHGGFWSKKVKSVMIGQIQISNLDDDLEAIMALFDNKDKLIEIANEQDPTLFKIGGGAFEIDIREIASRKGKIVVIHLLVDVKDAMGANIVNTMAEAIAPHIEEICDAKVNLRILSNLAMERIAKCQATFDKDLLGGENVVEGILDAYEFALADPFRAATHNKGIMNGITALALATGNDTRALEAGAHAFASLKRKYAPLSSFKLDENGNLVGELELPLAIGIIGGITKDHPMARIALKILDVKSAEELSQVAVALGLAQNVAALRALASEGIQEGHMKLHRRKISGGEDG